MIRNTNNHLPTITASFNRQVAKRPDAVAILFREQSLTYKELDDRSTLMAQWIRKQRKVSNDNSQMSFIPLCFCPGIERIVGMLAILKAGDAFVPIDPDFPESRIQYILQDIKADFLLTDSNHANKLRKVVKNLDHPIDFLEIDQADLENDKHPGNEIAIISQPGSPCYVMYTSGTTGRPKGVVVPHQAVTRLVLNTNYIEILPGDRVSQLSNIAFDASTFEIWGALLNGAGLVVMEKEAALNVQMLSEQIQGQQITTMFLTTGLFNQHISTNKECFKGLRYLLFGGGGGFCSGSTNFMLSYRSTRIPRSCLWANGEYYFLHFLSG